MSDKAQEIQAAIQAASARRQIAQAQHPELSEPIAPEMPDPSQRPVGYLPPGHPYLASNPAPVPSARAPRSAPPAPPQERLQTASFDDLLKEVDRRKLEAHQALVDNNVTTEAIEMELALRDMPQTAVETLRATPVAILRAELRARKAQDAGD